MFKHVACVDTSHPAYTGQQRDVGPVLVSPFVAQYHKNHSGPYTPLVYAAHRTIAAQNFCPESSIVHRSCGGIYYTSRRKPWRMSTYRCVGYFDVVEAHQPIYVTKIERRARAITLGAFHAYDGRSEGILFRREANLHPASIVQTFNCEVEAAYGYRITERGEILFTALDERRKREAGRDMRDLAYQRKHRRTKINGVSFGEARKLEEARLRQWVNQEGIPG